MRGLSPSLYFWRDKNGYIEIDCIVDRAGTLFPIEIKSAETVRTDLFTSLEKWQALTKNEPTNSYLVYGGDLTQKRTHGTLMSWKSSESLINKINKE